MAAPSSNTPDRSSDRPPGRTLVVVGDGEVAHALQTIAAAAGWVPVLVGTAADTEAALAGSGNGDAVDVVVLSHHDGVDGPALAAALGSGTAGYIGAMGSRRTQVRRRDWLVAHGVPEADLDRVHGPAGLDIGADSPGEIAVSIVAELIGTHRGMRAGSLRDRSGPLHPDLPPGTAECPAG